MIKFEGKLNDVKCKIECDTVEELKNALIAVQQELPPVVEYELLGLKFKQIVEDNDV